MDKVWNGVERCGMVCTPLRTFPHLPTPFSHLLRTFPRPGCGERGAAGARAHHVGGTGPQGGAAARRQREVAGQGRHTTSTHADGRACAHANARMHTHAQGTHAYTCAASSTTHHPTSPPIHFHITMPTHQTHQPTNQTLILLPGTFFFSQALLTKSGVTFFYGAVAPTAP